MTIAIIQARMSSSRLPGKVLQDLGGQPMLVRVVERTRRARSLRRVVVATTTDPSDDPVAALCAQHGYPCYRGSLFDVLDRYYQAAKAHCAERVVRITADCPVMDAEVVDATVEALHAGGADFAASRFPPPWGRTYPIGLDVEVCTFAALERAWKEADQPHQREHVMPYLYEDMQPDGDPFPHPNFPITHATLTPWRSPRGFRILRMDHDPDYGHYRWTVDTPPDLEALRRIYANFGNRDDFSWRNVIALYRARPELAEINADVQHKSLTDVDERL
ncbi:MAG: glycosyltransferase family protein [Anaerolineales bacterium]